MPPHSVARVAKKPLRLDDELQFIRSWIDKLLRTRYPTATVIQGDAYRLRRLLESSLKEPAAAVVSGLPLLPKPLRTRLRLLADVIALLRPGAPLVQFTYGVVPPIPKTLAGISATASNLVWLNLPPARVWVYRGR